MRPVDPIITQLRDTRRKLALHQQQVAYLIGVDRTSVTGWETGRIHPPLARVHAWAAVLGYALTLTAHDPAQSYRNLIAERDRLTELTP